MGCEQCNKPSRNDKIEKTKAEAIAYGKQRGLKYMVIVETVNGIPGYREPGDESLTRLKAIDHVLIT